MHIIFNYTNPEIYGYIEVECTLLGIILNLMYMNCKITENLFFSTVGYCYIKIVTFRKIYCLD